MSGEELIKQERVRQVEVEGYDEVHDDGCHHNELVDAGDAYLRFAKAGKNQPLPKFFPWANEYWKPSDDEARNLEKAGALYLAELERIKRNNIKDPESVEWLTKEVRLAGLMIDEILKKRNKVNA